MSAIRPDLPSFPPPTAGSPGGIRSAQAAFFRAALDQAQGVQTSAPASPTMQGPRSSAIVQPADTDRPMRPGALLDIRV